jgi:hypothetical protein
VLLGTARLGPELSLSTAAELTNLVDVRAKSIGAGVKQLLLAYACACALLLGFHAARSGLDAAGASAMVALAGGVAMVLVGLLWDWLAALIWPHLGAEQTDAAIYREPAGYTQLHRQYFHPLLWALVMTLFWGVLEAGGRIGPAPAPAEGVGMALLLGGGGAVPMLLLQAATLRVSWQHGLAWVLGAALQLATGGWLIGQLYFQPDCLPDC